MKIVVFSDLHIDAKTAGLSRFDDAEFAMGQVVRRAREEGAILLFLGDLCDPDAPHLIRCIRAAQQAATSVKRWIGIAGNHDVLEDGHGTTVLDLIGGANAVPVLNSFGSIEQARIDVVKEPSLIDLGEEKWMAVLPFTASALSYDPEEFLRSCREGKERVVVIATHLMLEGIEVGSETEDFPRGRDVFFPIELARELFPDAVIVAGHYHRPQVYRGVHVVGSLLALTKADAGREPRYLVLEV